MIRVVFDTNILFSAAFKTVGVPAQVLDLVTPGILTPCLSDAVMAEYLDVLTRPILRPHASRARDVLALMAKFAVHVSPAQKLSICSDPDDDRFLECALAADAAYLVTGNVRHFPRNYEPVAIVTPRQILDRLISDHA
jgi:putative PIN family toxin of toxin-antitoxin system